MTLGDTFARLLVGLVGLAVVAWGATVSARAVVRGPGWASTVLVRWRRIWVGVGSAGLLVALVDPPWVGLTIGYLALVAWWLAGKVGRGLAEALALGPYAPPPMARRVTIIYRTVLGLATLSAGSAALALMLRPSFVDLAALATAMALLLAVLAWNLWHEGTKDLLRAPDSD